MQQESNSPTLSIITPVFNLYEASRQYLIEKNIKSVAEQVDANIEHIVMDGGSTDGTLELLRKLQKKYCFTIYSEPDRSLFDGMNKGIKKANGTFVLFLNSDDNFHSRTGIKDALNCIIKSGSDFLYSDVRNINSRGEYIDLFKADPQNRYFGAFCCHQGMIVKKSVLEEIGCFDLDFGIAADVNFMQQLFKRGKKGVKFPEVFASYMVGGASQTDTELTRKESAKVIYANYGRDNSLDLFDCYFLWGMRFTSELPMEAMINIGVKIKDEKFRESYFNHVKFNISARLGIRGRKSKRVLSIFKKWPLISKEVDGGKVKYKIFDKFPIFRVESY